MDQKNSIVTNIYTIKLGRALKLIKAMARTMIVISNKISIF